MNLRRVALNALWLDPNASGGPETYLRGLLPALVGEFPGTRFEVVTTRAGQHALLADGWGALCRVRALPCEDGQRVRRQVAEQVLLPALARRARWDVLHSTASVAPIRARVPHVITVHDATFVHEQTFGRVTSFGMREVVTRAAGHADALVTATIASRDDVCRTLGLSPEQFSIVPHGVKAPPSGPIADEQDVRRRFALEGRRVVLCVGAKRPHKNQELLVRAARDLPEDVVVVLAGHPEAYDIVLRALAASEGVTDRLRFVDYLPDADLEALWRLSRVAAFPTRAEGFGLPILEAQARGIPVVCSDLAVLREVSGGHARFFPPDEPSLAVAAILAALDPPPDPSHGAAQEWAKRFTWAEAARATYAVYERACTSARTSS